MKMEFLKIVLNVLHTYIFFCVHFKHIKSKQNINFKFFLLAFSFVNPDLPSLTLEPSLIQHKLFYVLLQGHKQTQTYK